MAFRNPLGSVSALSLASDPAALITVAAVAGVALTVGAAVYTYKAYKKYEEKKHREAIEQINALHARHLARIYISDYNEIRGFPPIFKLTSDKDSSTADSMHMTDDEVRDIGRHLPHGTDIALSPYRESVQNAILKLKEYYFSRKERDDITAGVLSYLLYTLETKCLNFEGYDYDIAYLKAITDFITSYASLANRESTQHFSRLNPVFAYLTTARQALEKHQEALSLEELVSELRDTSIYQSNQLIRCLTKFFVRNRDWELIDTVTIDELSQGIIRREYIHTEVKGLVLYKDEEKFLDVSYFKEWIEALSIYYLDTLDPETRLRASDIIAPDQLFKVPDADRWIYLKTNYNTLTTLETEEFRQAEQDLNSIAVAFAKYPSFLTTKLDPATKNKLPRMIPVTDHVEVAERAMVLMDLAGMVQQVISLQYLCGHLLKSVKQLGEIYVKSPQHFCSIFYVLNAMCTQIKDDINRNKHNMTVIQRSDMNSLQLDSKEVLPNQLQELMGTLYATVDRLGAKVSDYRNRVAKNLNINEPTMQSVKMEMYEVASLLANIYKIKPGADPDKDDSQPASDPGKKNDGDTDGILRKPVFAPRKPDMTTLVNIGKALAATTTALPTAEQALYQPIIQSALALKNKSIAMLNEHTTDPARLMKAEKLLEVTVQLLSHTNDYLRLSDEDKAQKRFSFVNEIKSEIADPDVMALMNQHSRRISAFLYEKFKYTFFAPDSRQKLLKFEYACERLLN